MINTSEDPIRPRSAPRLSLSLQLLLVRLRPRDEAGLRALAVVARLQQAVLEPADPRRARALGALDAERLAHLEVLVAVELREFYRALQRRLRVLQRLRQVSAVVAPLVAARRQAWR